MTYRGYRIERGKPETLDDNKKRGIIEVYDECGDLVKIFLYKIGNHLSLTYAKQQAKTWVRKLKVSNNER